MQQAGAMTMGGWSNPVQILFLVSRIYAFLDSSLHVDTLKGKRTVSNMVNYFLKSLDHLYESLLHHDQQFL